MAAAIDPSLVAKALAKAQSVESRLNGLISSLSPEAPSIVYNTNSTVVTQNTVGDHTFTVPAGVTSIKVECWGAGAGAGGGDSGRGGEGGGGGEYACEPAYAVTPGAVLNFTVGTGGNGGSSGTSGNSGSDTFFDFPSNPTGAPYANGGKAGSGFTGGSGGTGSTNTIHFDGGAGGGNASQGTGGCGGGGAGGPDGGGLAGSTSPGSTGVAGGAGDNNVSPGASGGTGGAGGNNAANGNNGGSPGAGGGGCGAATGVTSKTITYPPIHTQSYYGADAGSYGGNPNATRNVNGVMYQGGETASGGGVNGTQKSVCIFNYTQMQSDFSGFTMTSANLRLQNQHSWYSSGMSVQIRLWAVSKGYPLPSSWDGTGVSVFGTVTIAEGAAHSYSMGTSVATAFVNGSWAGITLGPGSGNMNLNYYGYFSGGAAGPQLTLSGTSGGTPVNAGNGGDGQVRITYTTPSTIVAAVQPAAGTDSNGNNFTAGVSAQGVMLYGVATPSAPPSNTALLYGTPTPSAILDTGQLGQLVLSRGNVQTFTNSGSGSMTSVTAAWPIAANDANTGTVYRLKANGTITFQTTTNISLQILAFGSAQTSGGFNGFGTATTGYWSMEATIAIVSTGSTGSALMNLSGQFQQGSPVRGPSVAVSQGTGSAVTVDTTAATTMQIQVACGSGWVVSGYYSTFERVGS